MARHRNRPDTIAALDVGTGKTCCFIARTDGGAITVTGIGHLLSRGLRAGAVVDMAAASATVTGAVQAAEEMAGETVERVHLAVSAGQPASRRVEVGLALNGHAIGDGEVRRAIAAGRQGAQLGEREIVHALPLGFAVDGNRRIRDPRGLYGERMAVSVHLVTADPGPLRNLVACVGRAHLDVAAKVVAPYAAGLATLLEDEKEIGAIVLDMGAGTTGIAVFAEGEAVHTDVVPLGGGHVTHDIACGLTTTLEQAERLKALYGAVTAAPADERETIDVERIGEGEAVSVRRAELAAIIRPRLEETFELVRDRLAAAGLAGVAGRRLVLTGGASQLHGAAELAGRILAGRVRLGRPHRVRGLAAATAGPAFAACAGLLIHATTPHFDALGRGRDAVQGAVGRFGRIGRWFRDNL